MATFPVRLTSITDEANAIAPNRRKSSDGMLGDAAHRASGGDHNPDVNGIVHAVDVSQSMPGTPYWEPQFDQFDVHAWQRRIATAYVSAPEALRAIRWPWLHDQGGYMVGFDGRVDVIFDPTVSFGWRQNGSAKQEHNQHGHFSIAHNARSENDRQPIFTLSTSAPEEDMPLNAQDLELIRQIVKQEVGSVNDKTDTASGNVAEIVKHYFKAAKLIK